MGNHLSTNLLLFTILTLLSCFLCHVDSNSSVNQNHRQAIEIVVDIGGGGGGGGGGSGSGGGVGVGVRVGVGVGVGVGGGGGGGGGSGSGSGGGGGGGWCHECSPSTPEPESPSPSRQPTKPQPLTFIDERLAVVFPVIQRFKNIVTSDPFGVTQTWVGSDVCKYKGFFCESPPDNSSATALASIDFNGFRLSAPTINGFIDQLPDIALFHANSNNFAGTLSPNISKLPYLYELDLSNNKFTGSFPSAVLSLDNLNFLDLRFNSFSGTVPAQIFSLNLDVLFINNNNFIQRLPQNLGSTPSLYLTLANNKFVGPIPRSIGKASDTLIEVLFLNNQLSGCLPYEIGYLKQATVFDAGNNCLTGPIPCSFGCLAKMELLNFAGNLLYGQVPEVVCALGNLANLSLSDNYFTHVGPICRNLIKSGVLDVRKNCIMGLPMQRSTVECALFFSNVRICPYIASYGFIPCKLPDHGWGSSRSSRTSFAKYSRTAPSPSYSALVRGRS